jgi:Kef-type K+ transport system membrane component KefB
MSHSVDPVASVILWVTLIFLFGNMGRNIALRLKLPAVLGELMMGVFLGNVCYFAGLPLSIVLREGAALFTIMADLLKGMSLQDAVNVAIPNPYYAKQVFGALAGSNGNELLKVSYVVDIFSRYGVIFLLFLVGVESSITELKRTGRESMQVALIGVLAPMLLGLVVVHFLLPNLSFQSHLFIAATLSATSIGITARAFTELNLLKTREAKTVLGAAMMDDILGLIMLAVVSSLVVTGVIDFLEVGRIILSAMLFFIGSVLLGPIILKKMTRIFSCFEPWEENLFMSFAFAMIFSWLATLAQLATIIGAFAAGVIINDGYFRKSNHDPRNALTIRELLAPFEAILAPLFFMLIGIQVKLETFWNFHVIVVALALIAAAVIGKLLSGFGGNRRDDRLLIGIGMLPRGEVGLVFASIGRTLGVISDDIFSAVILMVIITTFIAPIWLKSRYVKCKVKHAA